MFAAFPKLAPPSAESLAYASSPPADQHGLTWPSAMAWALPQGGAHVHQDVAVQDQRVDGPGGRRDREGQLARVHAHRRQPEPLRVSWRQNEGPIPPGVHLGNGAVGINDWRRAVAERSLGTPTRWCDLPLEQARALEALPRRRPPATISQRAAAPADRGEPGQFAALTAREDEVAPRAGPLRAIAIRPQVAPPARRALLTSASLTDSHQPTVIRHPAAPMVTRPAAAPAPSGSRQTRRCSGPRPPRLRYSGCRLFR